MVFEENNKAIYLQIADRIADSIINGDYDTDQRLPSVREYAASIEVNANTVMRSYDLLASKNLIYNKRGIGYFVSEGAKARIIKEKSEDLIQNQLPALFKLMNNLGITPEALKEVYDKFLKIN